MIVDHNDDGDGNEDIHNCNYAINDGDDNDRGGGGRDDNDAINDDD